MTYKIIAMTPAHLDQVEELERTCFPEDPWSRQIFEDALESDNSSALVAEAENGAIIGYIAFTVVLDEGDVDNIAVAPQARRQGVAEAMLETFHYFAKQWGVARLTLDVRPSNGGAVRLYEKMGYREVGRRKNYYLKPKEDAIIMRLELTPCT